MFCPLLSYRNKYVSKIDCDPNCMMFDDEHEDCLIARALLQQINPLSTITLPTMTVKKENADEIFRHW